MAKIPVVKRKATRWFDYQKVISNPTTNWKSFFSGRNQITTNWTEYYPVTSIKELSYFELKSIKFCIQSSWNNRFIQGLKIETCWNVRSSIGIFSFTDYRLSFLLSRDIFYFIYQKERTVKILSFQSRKCVCKNASVSWKTEEKLPLISSTLTWNVSNFVIMRGMSCWKEFRLKSLEGVTSWDTKHLGKVFDVFYGVKSSVGVSNVVKYNVRLTLGKDSVIIWRDYIGLWWARLVRYKVFEEIQFIEPKRSVKQVGVLKGAYLPTVTLKRLDKKSKHKLGI